MHEIGCKEAPTSLRARSISSPPPRYGDVVRQQEQENEKTKLIELGRKLGISPEDSEAWYKVSIPDLLRHGGHSLLMKRNYSFLHLLQSVYPNISWFPSRFLHKFSKPVWSSKENVRAFLANVEESLGIPEGDRCAWLEISKSSLIAKGGAGLLKSYNSKLPDVLRAAYPEHIWPDETQFTPKPRDYWSSIENQRGYIVELGKKLGIKEGDYSAWYQVPTQLFLRKGGKSNVLHSRYKTLSTVFPEHRWVPWLFIGSKKDEKALLSENGSRED
jgi:hypothetical protein